MSGSAFPLDSVPSSSACTTARQTCEGGVESFTIEIEQPDATDYVLSYDSAIGGRIAELRITAAMGSGRVSVLINDVVVTGLDNVVIAAGARASFTAEALNIFATGDDIVLRVESGSNDLLGLKATVVISNKSVARSIDACTTLERMVKGVIPITDDLIGADVISIGISPALAKKPSYVFVSYFEKGGPDEDEVFQTAVSEITEEGWDVYLSAPAVENQILHYAYIS